VPVERGTGREEEAGRNLGREGGREGGLVRRKEGGREGGREGGAYLDVGDEEDKESKHCPMKVETQKPVCWK